MLARVLAVICHVFVRLSVRHTRVLCRNCCTDQAVFVTHRLPLHCVLRISRNSRTYLRNFVLNSERMKFGDGMPTIGECDI